MNTSPTLRARFIGSQIYARRRELGMSQRDLADAIVAQAFDTAAVELTVGRNTISQWESGRHEPALRYRPHLAMVLDVDRRVLFPNIGANDMAAA